MDDNKPARDAVIKAILPLGMLTAAAWQLFAGGKILVQQEGVFHCHHGDWVCPACARERGEKQFMPYGGL